MEQFVELSEAVSRKKMRDAHMSLMVNSTAAQGDEKAIKQAARSLDPDSKSEFQIPDQFVEKKSNEDVLNLIEGMNNG